MLGYFLISCLLLYAEGRPNDHRYRRDEDVNGVVYAPCKDTYNQCAEWKKSGMCDMQQYKDYMPLVCTETCGFCKAQGTQPEVVPTAAVRTDVQATGPKVETAASPDPAQKDKIQSDYEDQLKTYYQNLQKTQADYAASVSPQPAQTEAGTGNSGVPASPIDNLAPSVSAEAAPQSVPMVAYVPYGYGSQYGAQPAQPQAQAYPGYPAGYPAAAQPGGGASSSTSVGSSSSSTSSSSTDTSSGSSIGNLAPTNSTGNVTAAPSDASMLPSKVAPETPSLPALPPLLALPPISESLLVDDSKTNSTTSVEKETTTDNTEKDKQEADSKPYVAPEPEAADNTTTTTTTTTATATAPAAPIPKKEGKKHKQREFVKADADRKIITEDLSTNEMTKSESKHLTASAREPKTDDDNSDDDEDEEDDNEGDQKVIKAFSSEPGKIKLDKTNKKKSMDSDIKVTKHQRAQQKSEKEKPSENEDAVFKHDEKSVSDGGSGAAGLEESVEDLNYITDFNPDDFDMDVADISRKDLIRLHDKRDFVQFPKTHPLYKLPRYSRSGIQKARSEISAPHIIDATEDGVGDSPLLDAKAAPKSKEKLTKPAKKEEVTKVDESSGAPTEVGAKFFESPGGDEQEADDDEEDDPGVQADAEKKNKIKEETKPKQKSKKDESDKKHKIKQEADKKEVTAKNKIKTNKEKPTKVAEPSKRKNKITTHEEPVKKAVKKSKSPEPKPTIGMKSKISINFKKSDTKVHAKSKVASTKRKDNIEEKQEKKDKTVAKETEEEKSNNEDFMSEKGDTAAIRKTKNIVTTTKRKVISKAEAPKKRTNDDDKDTDTTIADLSGAGSGETDTDMLSGDSPTRSLDESGDNDEAEEDEEDDGDGSSRQRQNLQLHGDPEMVDLKSKETAEQPDLYDFPDSKEDKTFTAKEEAKEEAEEDTSKEDADKKNVSDDETELDDIKIEELLNPKAEEKKKKKKKKPSMSRVSSKQAAASELKEGKISLVLQQNFNVLYEKKDSPSYQMLAGNIKKDIEKMAAGTGVSDITFSEVSVEGNPRQSGKTKANFNIKAPTNDWMRDLLKLVDSGDIDGLRVIKGSLEIEEE